MATNTAKLAVEISAKAIKLKAGLDSGLSRIKDFAKKSVTVLKGIGTALAASYAATAAVVVAMVASNSAAIRQMIQLSNSIGVSVKSLSEWEAVAKSVGIESDKMGDILKDVGDKIGDYLVTGGGEAADIFERLNLDAREFVNIDASESLLKIGQAMQGLGTKEQVFLMESLADEASSLLPIFENNAAGYKAAIEEAVKSGNILTDNQAQSAAAFSASIAKMKNKITGFGKQITVQLSRPFAAIIDWIDQTISEMGGIDEAAKKFSAVFINGIAGTIIMGGNLLTYFDQLELKMKRIELWWAEKSQGGPVAWGLGKMFDKQLVQDVGGGDISKIEQEKKTLEERVAKGNETAKQLQEKAASLIGLLGAEGNSSLNNAANQATTSYKKSAGAVNKLTTAANKAAKAIVPQQTAANDANININKQSIASFGAGDPWGTVTDKINQTSRANETAATSIKGLSNAANKAAANLATAKTVATSSNKQSIAISGAAAASSSKPSIAISGAADPWSNSGTGLSGFSNKPIDHNVKSVQGYIDEMPAGKALQQMRQGWTSQTPGSGNTSGTINSKKASLKPDSFNGTSGAALDKMMSGKSMTKITLEMVLDQEKITGEVIASQAFINEVQRIGNKSANNDARQATQ